MELAEIAKSNTKKIEHISKVINRVMVDILNSNETYYRSKDCAEILGLTKGAFKKKYARGAFPAPDRVNGKFNEWKSKTIVEWLLNNKK